MDIKNYIYFTLATRSITFLENYMASDANTNLIYVILVCAIMVYYGPRYAKWLPSFIGDNESRITISSHRKKTNNNYMVGTDGEYVTLYSKYFRALSHHIMNTNITGINALIETNSIENGQYRNVEYILLPDIGKKVLICKKRNIYFEIINNEIFENNKYITLQSYKVSIPSPNKIDVIKRFLNDCEIVYNARTNKNKEQTIFEYIDYYINDDDDTTIELMFHEHTFVSNKVLGKNVFYDELPALVSYIEKFVPENYEENRAKYAKMGSPYKASILLYGPPGCGKTSTIKGILNRTGRHGLVVQWSKLKTCREFCSLFRKPVINGQKYGLSEICYIFEDFDANINNVVKTRSELSSQPATFLKHDDRKEPSNNHIQREEIEEIKEIKERGREWPPRMQESFLRDSKESKESKKTDALTLECVLNVLDGILELDNAMIIFTTNLPLHNIDPAFIRSGRIDFKMKLGHCSLVTIRKILELKFGAFEHPLFESLMGGVLLPCDVQNTCFKYDTVDECLYELAGNNTPFTGDHLVRIMDA